MQTVIPKPKAKELATTVTVPVSWEEDGQSVVTVTLVVDGHEVEEFHPMETWHSGDHILNLFYPLLDMQEKHCIPLKSGFRLHPVLQAYRHRA